MQQLDLAIINPSIRSKAYTHQHTPPTANALLITNQQRDLGEIHTTSQIALFRIIMLLCYCISFFLCVMIYIYIGLYLMPIDLLSDYKNQGSKYHRFLSPFHEANQVSQFKCTADIGWQYLLIYCNQQILKTLTLKLVDQGVTMIDDEAKTQTSSLAYLSDEAKTAEFFSLK